jgi:glycosyltransferase involved in cell wall biosynthesis
MKIAFVDQAYHEKTKSNDFFKNFLEANFNVDYLWIYTWQDKNLDFDAVNRLNYDAIIFFQVIPRPGKLKLFTCQNLIFVPMYDSVITKSNFNWFMHQIHGVKVISFSKFLYDKLVPIKFDALHVKYYPPQTPLSSQGEKLNIFFWQRSDEVNWNLVKKLIKAEDVASFTLRKAFDRDETFVYPSEIDMKRYNIKIEEGWMEKEEYLEMLKSSNLFIAPRAAEGIGLSFLEAMAFNVPILAPDAPTMNEYVAHGETGYLYDINDPRFIDFSNIDRVRNALKRDMVKGKTEWDASKESILAFIKKNNGKKFNIYRALFNIVFSVKEVFLKLTQSTDKS